jgi:hypothetical protein
MVSATQARLERSRDSRCVFTCCYAHLTAQLADRIDDGRFQDPEWIALLAERFAARYLDVLERADAGLPLGQAWEAVFGAIADRRSSVLEDLIFAITAHIVHDLPLALEEVGRMGGPSGSRLADYDSVNEVMGRAINSIRTAVTVRYSPGLRWMDRIERLYDGITGDYGFRMSRGLAWYNAERLGRPDCRAATLEAIERSPKILVESVRHPPWFAMRWLLRGMRLVASLFRRWPTTPPVEMARLL